MPATVIRRRATLAGSELYQNNKRIESMRANPQPTQQGCSLSLGQENRERGGLRQSLLSVSESRTGTAPAPIHGAHNIARRPKLSYKIRRLRSVTYLATTSTPCE